jgi:hypothetical protein
VDPPRGGQRRAAVVPHALSRLSGNLHLHWHGGAVKLKAGERPLPGGDHRADGQSPRCSGGAGGRSSFGATGSRVPGVRRWVSRTEGLPAFDRPRRTRSTARWTGPRSPTCPPPIEGALLGQRFRNEWQLVSQALARPTQ